MRIWRPKIVPPWSLSDLESILADALKVLEKIGVGCTQPRVRNCLAERGYTLSDERVYFPEELVREHLENKRAVFRQSPAEDDQFRLWGCWTGLNYCDPKTQKVRPASSAEASQMARLWDSRGLAGPIPVMPGDVPPALATLTAERIALENSRFLGGSLTVTDPEEVRYLIEMFAAAGRRYHLVEQVGISPLKFDHEGLTTTLCFLGNPDVDVSLTGFIPIAGATCPLDPRGAVVQSVAETLALDVLCSVLEISGGGLSIRVEPFDFQYSFIVFGSPEWCLYRALVFQMNEYLTGERPRYGVFRSVAKTPNAQAACERTASVLWQALLGARQFGAVGQLSVDEVFSPQQAVIDREILNYVKRVIDGLDFTSDTVDSLALIEEGVGEGSFVGVADTVSRFREFYWFPDIFRHWNLGRWQAEGEPSILDEAWTLAQQEIARSTYQLRQEQREEISRIYQKAKKYIENRS
ncbi:MAG: trimethylamine methyltransferase family protein [Candidatus Omnitrophica bacterium]|nr:trimethylamine methyltransferase family protein [Candidatus Omnitrophota bacterium]